MPEVRKGSVGPGPIAHRAPPRPPAFLNIEIEILKTPNAFPPYQRAKIGKSPRRSRHGKASPSTPLRAQLRERILDRFAESKLRDVEAAAELGLSPGQMSRLRAGEDVFSLERLIDAAANIGITVRMSATRPYRRG